MDLRFFGANCIEVVTKTARVVVDDTLVKFGGKSQAKPGDVLLFTESNETEFKDARLVIDQPGEYEVLGVSIGAIAARPFSGGDLQTSTIYKLSFDDTSILITGHIMPELSGSQAESIGTVDVMFVPVGGGGQTLGGADALKLIKKIEPKVVIPTYYADGKLKLPESVQTLDKALAELGLDPQETTDKLKLKPSGLADASQQLIVLKP